MSNTNSLENQVKILKAQTAVQKEIIGHMMDDNTAARTNFNLAHQNYMDAMNANADLIKKNESLEKEVSRLTAENSELHTKATALADDVLATFEGQDGA